MKNLRQRLNSFGRGFRNLGIVLALASSSYGCSDVVRTNEKIFLDFNSDGYQDLARVVSTKPYWKKEKSYDIRVRFGLPDGTLEEEEIIVACRGKPEWIHVAKLFTKEAWHSRIDGELMSYENQAYGIDPFQDLIWLEYDQGRLIWRECRQDSLKKIGKDRLEKTPDGRWLYSVTENQGWKLNALVYTEPYSSYYGDFLRGCGVMSHKILKVYESRPSEIRSEDLVYGVGSYAAPYSEYLNEQGVVYKVNSRLGGGDRGVESWYELKEKYGKNCSDRLWHGVVFENLWGDEQ